MNIELLELAQRRFGNLSAPEERFFTAAAQGGIADYLSPNEAENDLTLAVHWGPERVLNAERIVWLCTDPAAAALVTHRGLGVRGARIDGRLDLRYADVNMALYFDKCSVPGGIGLLGAEIHSLNLAGTHTSRVSADGLKTEGGVFLRDGFVVTGSVRLLGASIGGDFDCGGGRFVVPGNVAIAADGLKVAGSVSLNDGFQAEGQVRLLGMSVGGNLDCNAGKFINPGREALMGDRIKVEGNVFLGEGVQVTGKVGFPGSTIEGYFIYSKVAVPQETTLDLRSSKIGTLRMTEDSWPQPGKLLLHGLIYEEMDDPAGTTVETRIRWLQRQPSHPFRPQPYEQLAAVLRHDGQDVEAKRIMYAKERDRSRFMPISWSQWPWYRLFGPLIGYGYRPWRAFWISLFIIFLGATLFGIGAANGIMAPTKVEAYVTNELGHRQLSDEYPSFNAFMYSLDMFTPLIGLDQADFWLPNANRGTSWNFGLFTVTTGGALRIYMWFHIMAGWILSSLLFVGLTGTVPGT